MIVLFDSTLAPILSGAEKFSHQGDFVSSPQGALILFSVLVVPLRIGFALQDPPNMSFAYILDWIVDVMFGIDIIANFRTAYFDNHGVLVTDLGRIRRNYMRGFFIIDFVSTVPFDRILPVGRGAKLIRVLRLVRLFKLLRLFRIGRAIESLQEMGVPVRAIHSTKLILQLSFLAHLLACGWFFVFIEIEDLGLTPCEGGHLGCTSGSGMEQVCTSDFYGKDPWPGGKAGECMTGWANHADTRGLSALADTVKPDLGWSYVTSRIVVLINNAPSRHKLGRK